MSGKTYNGKCHCGETAWTVELPTAEHILCHCDTCKVLSGGAYTLNQIIPKKNFQLTKGSLKHYTYTGDSGKKVNCYFCPNCTTHPYHHQEVMGPDTIVVRTVLLDGGDKFPPHAEIFGKVRMDWEKEVAQTFPLLPPQ